MRLYMIESERERDYIEAETIGEAIAIWREGCLALNEADLKMPSVTEAEPDQVVLIHETSDGRAVLRTGERHWEEPADAP